MNPKAITDYQMFGKLDVATNDWTDGIFSSLWRRAMKRKGEFTWIVLDGPVDAVWIESLNSVLDDNKCLTLANGDRLPLPANCKLVFEVHSLRNASPATVSRCGMIYIGLNTLPWTAVFQSWLRTRTKEEVPVIEDIVNRAFDETYSYLLQHLHPQMEILANAYLETFTSLLGGVVQAVTTKDHLRKLVTFALFWTFGSLLENEDRAKLQRFMIEKFSSVLPFPDFAGKGEDDEQSLFDYHVAQNGSWEHWGVHLTDLQPNNLFVPTTESMSIGFILDALVKRRKPVLLIGEPGTAKTTMLGTFVESLPQDKYVFKQLALSSTTSTQGFQKMVESSLDKKMGNTYGPPNGKAMCFFLDDFSIPDINQWGDQPTLEIMRQLLENEGFYSLDRPGWYLLVSQ